MGIRETQTQTQPNPRYKMLRSTSYLLADANKSNQSFEPHFGYFTNEYKDGYRFLTGPYMQQMPLFDQGLCNLGEGLDTLCKSILESTDVFGSKELLKQMVPLLAKNEQPVQEEFHDGLGKLLPTLLRDSARTDNTIRRKVVGYGMFDIVRYHHSLMKDFNVQEHIDPGLFSISILSTSPGLQMFDPHSNMWIEVPHGHSVLWAGEIAETLTSGRVKAGKHRVVTESQPSNRKTMWYEVCIDSQVPNSLLQNEPFVKKTNRSSSQCRTIQVCTLFKTHTLEVDAEYGTLRDVMLHLEKKDGIPSTKRLPRFYLGDKPVERDTMVKDIPPNETISFM